MKKNISLALALVMVLSLLAGCGGSASAPASSAPASSAPASSAPAKDDSLSKPVYLTLSGGNSSAESYTYWVAVSKAIQEVEPNLQITVVDATGGVDVAKRVRAGSIDCGNGVATTDYESYTGTGTFEGEPFEDLRVLWYYVEVPMNVAVDASLGLTKVNELDGVNMHPGGTGTANAIIAQEMCEAIGVAPKWFEASAGDGVDAVCNRKIAGTFRNGAPQESLVLQMMAALDIRLLTLTDEEVDKIQEQYPYLKKSVIPAGSYDKQDYDVTTISWCQGGVATPNLTQAQGYAMISALMSEKGRASWTAAYPKGARFDVIDLTLTHSQVPLHAGVVQYLVENGYDVPERLIPPEYVPVV